MKSYFRRSVIDTLMAGLPGPPGFVTPIDVMVLMNKIYFSGFNPNSMVIKYTQGIDGSARKPALIQDTGYMVEKTYHNIWVLLGPI